MLTVAGSARGKRSTPRSRNEKTPSTTRNAISITAKTPRLTQSSASVIERRSRQLSLRRHGRAVAQLLARERHRHVLAALTPVHDLDLVALALARA